MLYCKNILHSLRWSPIHFNEKSIFIVIRINLIHICFKAVYSFFLQSQFPSHSCVLHSESQQERSGEKKVVIHLNFYHVLPMKSNIGLERHTVLPGHIFKQSILKGLTFLVVTVCRSGNISLLGGAQK